MSNSVIASDEMIVSPLSSEAKTAVHRVRTCEFLIEEKAQPLASEVMCVVFWDMKRVILLGFLEPGQNISSSHCITSLTKLKVQTSRASPEKKTTFLLQHNSRPHTSLGTMEHTANLGWPVLSHPPYSPDLASSDFGLFRPMKGGLHVQHFPSNSCHSSCETGGPPLSVPGRFYFIASKKAGNEW